MNHVFSEFFLRLMATVCNITAELTLTAFRHFHINKSFNRRHHEIWLAQFTPSGIGGRSCLRLAGLGITSSGNTPAEFRKQIEEDLARYKEVVASANIKAD